MTRTSKHLDQLEREIEEYKAYNAQLREDVARLREALSYYASESLGEGAIARAALQEANDE